MGGWLEAAAYEWLEIEMDRTSRQGNGETRGRTIINSERDKDKPWNWNMGLGQQV